MYNFFCRVPGPYGFSLTSGKMVSSNVNVLVSDVHASSRVILSGFCHEIHLDLYCIKANIEGSSKTAFEQSDQILHFMHL